MFNFILDGSLISPKILKERKSKIDKYYKKEKSAYDDAQNGGKGAKNLINADGKINTPAFAEASKPYKGKTSYK